MAVSSATPVDLPMRPGVALTSQTASAAGARYRVSLEKGQAAELLLQQERGSMEVRVEHAGRVQSLEVEAGRKARIAVPVVADEGEAVWVSVLPRRGKGVVEFEVAMSPARLATSADRGRVAAFDAYMAGERLRRASVTEMSVRARDEAKIAQSRAKYEGASRGWSQVEDGCGARLAKIGLARLEVALGNYSTGRAAAAEALNCACADGPAEEAQAAKTLAMAAAYQGDFAVAVSGHERALSLYRRTGDQRYEGITLGNLAEVYWKQGSTRKALDAARGSLRLAEATEDGQGIVFGRNGIAAIHVARGEWASALQAYTQTLADLEKWPYPMIEGEVWDGLGVVHQHLADHDESLRAFAKAQDVWKATDNRVGMADTALHRGEALLAHDQPRQAGPAFAEALDLARANGLQSAEVRALRGLGLCAMATGDWSGARHNLEASRAGAQKIGELAAQAQAHRALGDLDARTDQTAQAGMNYERALQLGREAADLGIQATTLASQARLYQRTGQLAPAAAVIEQALAIIEAQVGAVSEPNLRTGYFASLHSYYELGIDILMQLDAKDGERPHAPAALALAERARARSLQDGLAERAIDVRHGVDPNLAAAEALAREDFNSTALQLARLPGNANAAARTPLEEAVQLASRQLDRVRGQLRTSHPRYAELTHPQPFSLPELQETWLDAQTVVLEYWLGEQRSYAWVITRRNLRALELPGRKAIESLADELLDRVRVRDEGPASDVRTSAARERDRIASVYALSRKLASMVLGDALDGLKQRQLAVVADGTLQLVPFGLLLAGGRDAVVANLELTHLPSLSTLHWLRTDSVSHSRGRAVAVLADPVFRRDDERLNSPGTQHLAQADVTRSLGNFDLDMLARLPYSRAEARAITSLLPRQRHWLAVDFAANRDAVLSADWRPYSVVHFAAHTLVDLQHPELSGIVLSMFDPQGRPQDGILRMNDIYNLDMPADLVVLSACDSGAGKAVASEGVFSLSRAFFYAGAPRVLASLWAVDDRATAVFMTKFYEALLVEKQSPAAALRAAQLELAGTPRWRSPYYWAGFVLQGDWRMHS